MQMTELHVKQCKACKSKKFTQRDAGFKVVPSGRGHAYPASHAVQLIDAASE